MQIGDTAPNFTLPDQNKEPVRLSDLRGKRVVVAFHPFAFTGICDDDLCGLRDDLDDLRALNAEVLVVSPDSPFVHKRWADEQGFDFRYLSDYWPHGEAARSFGVLNEALGVPFRSTFVIDEEGVVRFADVQDSHPGEARDVAVIRKALEELG